MFTARRATSLMFKNMMKPNPLMTSLNYRMSSTVQAPSMSEMGDVFKVDYTEEFE